MLFFGQTSPSLRVTVRLEARRPDGYGEIPSPFHGLARHDTQDPLADTYPPSQCHDHQRQQRERTEDEFFALRNVVLPAHPGCIPCASREPVTARKQRREGAAPRTIRESRTAPICPFSVSRNCIISSGTARSL